MNLDAKELISFFLRLFEYLDTHPEIVEEIFKTKQSQSGKESKETKVIIDIYQIYEEEGKEKLRNCLEGLTVENLKEIVRYYRLDPKGYFRRWKTKRKFISFIIDKTEKRLEKGKVFMKTENNSSQSE
jgi:FAD/FMN-containing dehydrogenase